MNNPEQKLTGGSEAKLNPDKEVEEKARVIKQEANRLTQEDEKSSSKRANEIRAELGIPVQAPEQLQSALSAEEKAVLADELKRQYNDVGLSKRATLRDEMFMAGQGINPETSELFETVDGKIGMNYDAHGVAKTKQLEQLLNLLENGISKDHDFYTAPFEVPAEIRAGLASALGTAGGTAYKDGLAVLTSGYREKIQTDGIKHVFINDVFSTLRGTLEKIYPQYEFHLLSEQKKVMEGEAAEAEEVIKQ